MTGTAGACSNCLSTATRAADLLSIAGHKMYAPKGVGAAADLAGGMLDDESRCLTTLRERLWQRLAAGAPRIVRVSPREDSLPNTLMVAVPGALGADLLADVTGVAASTGSACHTGEHTPSASLLALGLQQFGRLWRR